jgi:hypothetical protein
MVRDQVAYLIEGVVVMKVFALQTYAAVRLGKLSQPFNAAMVRKACPGWADNTYNTFLGKYAVGNGKETERFVRVGRGLYKLVGSFEEQCGIRKLRGKVRWEGNLNRVRLD